jgi:hypothetical protein
MGYNKKCFGHGSSGSIQIIDNVLYDQYNRFHMIPKVNCVSSTRRGRHYKTLTALRSTMLRKAYGP